MKQNVLFQQTEPDMDLAVFIAGLPKTETHLHIEGALPWQLLQGLDGGKYTSPPDSWRRDFRFNDFVHFEEELLSYAGAWYQTPDRYHEAARLIFQNHLDQNVRYVETSFASGVLEFFDISGAEVADAIRAAVPTGLDVRIFMGIHHNGYTDKMKPAIDDCLNWRNLDGLDLHGTETFPIESWTAPLWEAARQAGKMTKAHAGEFCGPDFVRRVVEELGVRRIEHGVRAAEDPECLKFLQRNNVVLNVCPISNVKLRVVKDITTHPIRELLAAGITCTVNTDDPVSFGNTLCDEYAMLATGLGFSRQELAGLARNGFMAATISDNVRQRYLMELSNQEGNL